MAVVRNRVGGAERGDPRASPLFGLAARILDARHPALLQLAQLCPARMLADVARCYLLIGVAWALLASAGPWWVVAVPCFLLIGSQQYALAILAHDGRHGRLLHGRRANDWFTRLVLSAPILHDVHYESECAIHLAHHRTIGTPGDPERHLYAASGKATRSAFLLYLTGVPAVPKVLAKMLRGPALAVTLRPRWVRMLNGWGPPLALQVVIATLVSTLVPWWYYVTFWLGPLYVCVFVPKKIRVLCEHGQALLPDEAADEHRLITFVSPAIERWLLAPMNMNYHAEHHLWPFVPYYNLKALHRLIGPIAAIQTRHSYVGFLREYFRQLPLEETPSPVEPVGTGSGAQRCGDVGLMGALRKAM